MENNEQPKWLKRRSAFLKAHAPPTDIASPNPWRSRGYLPHFDQPGLVQAITFRLADALPASVIVKWQRDLSQLTDETRDKKLHVQIEKYLDAGHGACWLQTPDIAKLVENTLLHFDVERYRMLAWCVMPNHVHVVVEMTSEWSLAEIVQSWKSYTAKEANKLLHRQGTFWQREYFDRAVRDGVHFENVIRYIKENPVKAGLVSLAEEWAFSNARFPQRLPSKPFV